MRKTKGNKKLVQTTANTLEEAQAVTEAGFDMFMCKSNNTKLVRSGAPKIFLTASIDLAKFPTEKDVLCEAFKTMENGADSVFTQRGPHIVEILAKEEIPVMCHLGLVPRKSGLRGGLRAIGKTADEALKLFQDFKTMENAGAFSVEAEVICEQVMTEITKRTSLLTSSLGSGWGGDIIYLFQNDICGEEDWRPRHARAFRDIFSLKKKIRTERTLALKAFKNAVSEKSFPSQKETSRIDEDELNKFINLLSK